MEKSKGSAWGNFGDCVAMVTARLGDKENAMPATWVIPVSFSPQFVAVNIAPPRYTHDMIKKSKKFAVSILADDQMELSRYAGSCSGKTTDKFKKIKKFYGESGVPLIKGSVACIECEVVDEVNEGDHTVFTGKVLNTYSDENKGPLVLFRGKYFVLGKSLGSY